MGAHPMITGHTVESLIEFERTIAEAFNAGKIRSPIHLDGGNEQQLIDIFKDVRAGDWVFCSWRSHYKALLRGVPPALVRAEILAGRSISLCFPEYRFLSSGIVSGMLSWALGVAWQVKRAGRDERVWCFLGDMTKRTGAYHECHEYACGHDLPITYVTEDNGKSVCTPTWDVWGEGVEEHERWFRYELTWPHSGAGKRVEF